MNRQDAKGIFSEPSPQADRRANEVIGAGIEVHRFLGPGFLESVYEQALARELAYRDIPFKRQMPVGVSYKGELVGEGRLGLLLNFNVTLLPEGTKRVVRSR